MIPNTPKGLPLRTYRGVTEEAHLAIKAIAAVHNISQGAVISHLAVKHVNKVKEGIQHGKANTN